jgi:GNAT superfamily N-acetyltransferase
MAEARVRIRRGRRTDFTAVMHLLAASGVPVPPPERATLRRFRQIVADLGADFYLALVDGTLAGLVHVTYARQLPVLPAARLEQLVVAEAFRRRGIGTALLAFARQRARQRGCATLACVLANGAPAARVFLAQQSAAPAGDCFALPLPR